MFSELSSSGICLGLCSIPMDSYILFSSFKSMHAHKHDILFCKRACTKNRFSISRLHIYSLCPKKPVSVFPSFRLVARSFISNRVIVHVLHYTTLFGPVFFVFLNIALFCFTHEERNTTSLAKLPTFSLCCQDNALW